MPSATKYFGDLLPFLNDYCSAAALGSQSLSPDSPHLPFKCLSASNFPISLYSSSFFVITYMFENKDPSSYFCTLQRSLAVRCREEEVQTHFLLAWVSITVSSMHPTVHPLCTHLFPEHIHPQQLLSDSIVMSAEDRTINAPVWASALKQLPWKLSLVWECICIESIRTKSCYNMIVSSLFMSKTHRFLIVGTSESNTVPES